MPEVSNLFVVLMGVGTVFFGLICIIILCMAMSAVCRSMERRPWPHPPPRQRPQPPPQEWKPSPTGRP